MKNILKSIFVLFLISACTNTVEENTVEEQVITAPILEENTDIVYNDSLHKITSTPNEMGEIFTIFNKQNKTSFTTEYLSYFVGVYGNYMLTEDGSGPDRDLTIYDLNSQKIIFEHSYMGHLVILKNKINFKSVVTIENESDKPECPQKLIDYDGLCYLEELIYDLNKNKFIRTGQYECVYCQ